ncbi:MAG: tyrosine-type recombinase/integrase [Chloroflexi bacterium]|nr:tyrosine-type recombinase/integrase [Chloroflexota bacterium]
MQRPKTLSATFVKTISVPGRYGDGRGGYGLSLLVQPTSTGRLSKTWSQRLRIAGKPFNMGLGAYPVVTLAEARQAALENRRVVARGRDPRRGGVPTLAAAVDAVIAIHAAGWRDDSKNGKQWRASLGTYVLPQLGRKPVDQVTSADVLAVLVPIWSAKPETARRVRQRIQAVMRWAIAEGYRDDNPAGEAIAAALPKNGRRQEHHRALPHAQVGAALARVRASEASPTTKFALEFLTLTACRSGEVRGARWEEFDRASAIWTVPGARMKAGREHRVPLSQRALEVLDGAREYADGSGLVFPSTRGGALSVNALSTLLRDLGIAAVPHGMRSSFRDWAAECTDAPREVCELALAHVNSDRVEAAYRRSDLFERRRALMEDWAAYIMACDEFAQYV